MNFKEIWMEFRKKCWPTVCGKWLTMVLFIDMIITNCLQELSMDWQNLDERCYRLLMHLQFLEIITNQFLNNKKTDFIWDNRIDNFRFIGQKNKNNSHSSKHPQFLLRFYYDWRHQFAVFCTVSYFCDRIGGKTTARICSANRGKSEQNSAF